MKGRKVHVEFSTIDGQKRGMLLDEHGHIIGGGPIEFVRSQVIDNQYTVVSEFERGNRPEFPKPDYNAEPPNLGELGKKAREIILAVAGKYELTNSGGCKTFYSPAEWEERGEEYGQGSELIVVYDGGDFRNFFSMDACYAIARPGINCYAFYEEMQAALNAVGLHFEECTGWFAAIYKD